METKINDNNDNNNNNSRKYTFLDLGLKAEIVNGLKDAGISEPSPIQVKAIPLGREGKDLLIQVTPGTGKTITFSSLSLATVRLENRLPQVLILSPTRDLARLTSFFINKIGKYVPAVICQCFVPGGPLTEDILHLVDCQIVTGTPDSIKKLIDQNHLNLSSVSLIVLNEVDQLIDKGFFDQILSISTGIPSPKQFLTFTAKYTPESLEKLKRIVTNPQLILSFYGVKVYYAEVPPDVAYKSIFEWKFAKMEQILKSLACWNQCLVYVHQMSKDQHQTLLSKTKEIGWSLVVVEEENKVGVQADSLNVVDQTKNFSTTPVVLQSLKKSSTTSRLLVVNCLQHLQMFDSLNLIFCLTMNISECGALMEHFGTLGPDCVSVVVGEEKEIYNMIHCCMEIDIEPNLLPSIIPKDFYTSPKKPALYKGILVPPAEMNNYQEMAKKAKNIKNLMDTETWTHPRQNDVVRKIRRWRQELVDASPNITNLNHGVGSPTKEEEEHDDSQEDELPSLTQYPAAGEMSASKMPPIQSPRKTAQSLSQSQPQPQRQRQKSSSPRTTSTPQNTPSSATTQQQPPTPLPALPSTTSSISFSVQTQQQGSAHGSTTQQTQQNTGTQQNLGQQQTQNQQQQNFSGGRGSKKNVTKTNGGGGAGGGGGGGALHARAVVRREVVLNPEELYDPHYDQQFYVTAFIKDEKEN